MSPEHQFLVESIDKASKEFSQTSLLGVLEADRKKFDYACILQRDMNRPLISQVLWSNFEGIEKDLRTLIHDKEAKLKLYVFKDGNRARAKISEIIDGYKMNQETSQLLNGLRFFPIPGDFDADVENQQQWIYSRLKLSLFKDIIFNIIFGGLRKFDMDVFLNHGGPYGLKFSVLEEVTLNGLLHNPTFKESLGYKTTGTIRECLAMLNGVGLIRNVPHSNNYLPTIKGRLFLDLSRKISFERLNHQEWSAELQSIFHVLNIPITNLSKVPLKGNGLTKDPLERLLHDVNCTKTIFGRDLLEKTNKHHPQFYDNIFLAEIREKYRPNLHDGDITWFEDQDSLLFINDFL